MKKRAVAHLGHRSNKPSYVLPVVTSRDYELDDNQNSRTINLAAVVNRAVVGFDTRVENDKHPPDERRNASLKRPDVQGKMDPVAVATKRSGVSELADALRDSLDDRK